MNTAAVQSALAQTIAVRPIPLAAASPLVAALRTQCSTCHLRDQCLACGLDGVDLTRLDAMKFTRRKIMAGETVYREGDRFNSIYAIRIGTVKSSLTLTDGREQVSGFHIAGDMVGLDGLAEGRHASSTVALEDTETCAIPYAGLAELAAGTSGMQHLISRLMSREILREHSLMVLLGSMNAEERLAAFLLDLSKRYAARGYSEREFHLRMSRAEIGSYLGLKLETVSRTFSGLQQQRLLEVDKRHIRITDLDLLKRRFDVRVH